MFHPLTTRGDTWMKDKSDAEALAALKKAIDHGDDRRSPLYRWMWTNHDKFAGMLEGVRPNWKKLSEVFAGLGFFDGDKTLRPDTVRQTWYRVRRAKEAIRRARKPKTESVGLAPDVVREVAPSPKAVNTGSRVSPIVPVNMDMPRVSPTVSVEGVRSTPERDERSDPDAVMRALDEQLNARRPKMPKPIK